jgi:hypothetical protein
MVPTQRAYERAAARATGAAKRAEAERKAPAVARKIVEIWNARQAGGRALWFCQLGGRRFAVVCAAVLMSGCAQSDLFSPYAAPGKYDFLDCPSIANQFKAQTAREQQLRELMSRAQESSGGAIVNAVVYQDDFNTVRANIRQLRKAAEAKHCPADVVPAPQ